MLCSSLENVYCYAVTPPSADLSCFYASRYRSAKLHVLEESLVSYLFSRPWSDCANVVTLTDTDPNPTRIKQIDNPEKGENVIYDLNGRKVEHPQRGLNIIKGSKYLKK